jgi:hypothetical protein
MVNRMKATMQSAIGSLVLLRHGRRQCAELDEALNSLQIAELTPETRKVIERHAGRCKACQEQQKKLASPFAVFAAIGLIVPAVGVKEGILSNVSAQFETLYDDAYDGSTLVQDVGHAGEVAQVPELGIDDDDGPSMFEELEEN